MNAAAKRYQTGDYDFDFGDDRWKARYMAKLIGSVPDLKTVTSYADIGCGNGGVFVELHASLLRAGFPIQKAVGYDIASAWTEMHGKHPEVEFRQCDFAEDGDDFDLATLNDVVEHLTCPQALLAQVGRRCRFVALHIPLDDRLSVVLGNQWNWRIGPIGHISMWNTASALNLLTASGLVPLRCTFTPGFLAPSGRHRVVQKLSLPFRFLLYWLSPGLAAATLGGVSLAVLCRGARP